MSRTSPTSSKPGAIPGGAATMFIRSTTQSLPFADQAPGGIVTSALPSEEVRVVAFVGLVFTATPGPGSGGVRAFPVSGGVLSNTVTWTLKGVVLPAASRSVPDSVCAPMPSGPVLNVSWLQTMTGVSAVAASSVPPTIVTGSLVLRTIELTPTATSTDAPSAGVELTSVGATLSTRIPGTTLDELLSSESDAVARRSYTPSVSVVVSSDPLHGAAPSVATVVQLLAPAGLASKTTLDAEALVVAVSVTVPLTAAPGLLSVTLGGVELTCTESGTVMRSLPALSSMTARRS